MLADILDDASPGLIAGVEASLSALLQGHEQRRVVKRLPAILLGLVERLRGMQAGRPEDLVALPGRLDIVPALRSLRESIYALIEDRQTPATPREMRIVGDWFAALTEAALIAQSHRSADLRLQILSKLSTVAEVMDYESVLKAMAQLSIPELADWCIMYVVDEGGSRRTTVAHRDPSSAPLADELLRLPPRLLGLPFAQHVMKGDAFLITDFDATADTLDPELATLLRRMGARSAMLVPFLDSGRVLAVAIFLLTSESGRRYGDDDLGLAEEIASRAAPIVANAWLHQQLSQSEARFRVALAQANISVFETDLDLVMRWGYNSQLGVTDRQFIGRTVSDVLGDVGLELDQLKRRVIATGETAGRAFSATIDGGRRHFMVRYEVLKHNGATIGLTGATIDVTELKAAEEQLARELSFRERTMGILGHDLRNPLSAILSIADTLRRQEGASNRTREGLALIEHSARRMNEMIGTLLDFTRLRFHGSLPVEIEDVDLDELSRSVVAEMQVARRGRDITLSVTGNVRGQWDPGRIAQLLSNLVANALVHGSKESGVRVELTDERDVVIVNVTNRGPTIPADTVERLFEPFQQGAVAEEGPPRGLGLGLFIVREIVRAHSGTIDVHSDNDLTTFAVKLPKNVH